MAIKPATYDTRCHDLASVFLEAEPELDTPECRDELAREIQQSIEDWIIWKQAQRKQRR